ncbi:MAG: hypothetical protein Q8Q42_02180 [Nanoarchaeota archaeon]|nr:hypothetical protein [Nanoarchaeota archaeon]
MIEPKYSPSKEQLNALPNGCRYYIVLDGLPDLKFEPASSKSNDKHAKVYDDNKNYIWIPGQTAKNLAPDEKTPLLAEITRNNDGIIRITSIDSHASNPTLGETLESAIERAMELNHEILLDKLSKSDGVAVYLIDGLSGIARLRNKQVQESDRIPRLQHTNLAKRTESYLALAANTLAGLIGRPFSPFSILRNNNITMYDKRTLKLPAPEYAKLVQTLSERMAP